MSWTAYCIEKQLHQKTFGKKLNDLYIRSFFIFILNKTTANEKDKVFS